jgi:gas vesicle protein
MASKFLTGLAVGVLAGILLAPDKGSETRRKLSEKGNDLKDKFNDFIDSIHEKFSDVKEEAEDAATDIKKKAKSYSGGTTGNSWAG